LVSVTNLLLVANIFIVTTNYDPGIGIHYETPRNFPRTSS